jgi:hypothetical protein
MHTYSTPTNPPSRSSKILWSGRWDRQYDGVVSMVESFRWQDFACLHGGTRTEKGGFKNWTAAPRELGQTKLAAPCSFYSQPILHQELGQRDLRVTHANKTAPPDQIDPSIDHGVPARAACAYCLDPLDGLATRPTRRPGVPAHQRPEPQPILASVPGAAPAASLDWASQVAPWPPLPSFFLLSFIYFF